MVLQWIVYLEGTFIKKEKIYIVKGEKERMNRISIL